MSLYAIGDFHLSGDCSKPMDIFGENWVNHQEKLKNSFSELKDDDVTVLCGDLSWAMGLETCLPDFKFVDSLPGKKIIIKGNHDYWWTTVNKINNYFRINEINSIEILHNNSIFYDENTALCGTRGWFIDDEVSGHDKKILNREVGRLKRSLDEAGDRNKIVFLHYPPVYSGYSCEEIISLLKEYGVRMCCYGHLHGKSCKGAVTGWFGGIEYKLVSSDYLNFIPNKLL